MRQICSWCNLDMNPGKPAGAPISHGICIDCIQSNELVPVERLSELTEAMADQLPYGVIELDVEGFVRLYNATERRLASRSKFDVLGRHFFNMDFETADQYSGLLSKTFIAELMPPNPIYVTLLSDAAREALGQPHSQTRATYELLQREGFRAGCYLDIFDAGPVLEARTDALRSVVTSHPKTLHAAHTDDGETCLICGGEGGDFRSTLTPLSESLQDQVKVPPKTWEYLGLSSGNTVRVTPL